MATGAKEAVISGDGWSYNPETFILEVTGDIQDGQGRTGYVDGNALSTSLSPAFASAGVSLSSVTSIKFGEGVTNVSNFNGGYYSSYLQSVSFPSTLEKIADHAFSSDSSLQSVTFDPGATGVEIGGLAFDCYNLYHKYVELPDNAKVATEAFGGAQPKVSLGGMEEDSLSYAGLSSAAAIICRDSSCVQAVENAGGHDNIPIFAPDASGVYSQVNLSSGSQAYYASVEDLLNDNSCETYDVCKVLAAANNSSTTGGGNGGSGGSVNNNSGSQSEPKRIYTLEEARQAVEASGKETVNVRIRYK